MMHLSLLPICKIYFSTVLGQVFLISPLQVFLHKLGTNTKEDILLYEEELPENFLSLTRSKDGLYLFVCSNSKIASEVKHTVLSFCSSLSALLLPVFDFVKTESNCYDYSALEIVFLIFCKYCGIKYSFVLSLED